MPTPLQRPRSGRPSCVAGVCLVAALPAAAAAQAGRASDATSTKPPDARVPRIVVAGGVDADGRAETAYPPQLALHVGYQLKGGERVGGSRFGLRAGLDFTASNAESAALRLQGPYQTRRSRGLGVVLLGTYALTRGPVRPYLVGGGGVYALHSVATYQRAYSEPGQPERKEVADGAHMGVSVGAGLSAPVGRVVLFGEARATLLPTAALSDTPGFRGTQVPLTLGVRF